MVIMFVNISLLAPVSSGIQSPIIHCDQVVQMINGCTTDLRTNNQQLKLGKLLLCLGTLKSLNTSFIESTNKVCWKGKMIEQEKLNLNLGWNLIIDPIKDFVIDEAIWLSFCFKLITRIIISSSFLYTLSSSWAGNLSCLDNTPSSETGWDSFKVTLVRRSPLFHRSFVPK